MGCQPPWKESWIPSEGCGHRGRGLTVDAHECVVGGGGVAKCEGCKPSFALCAVGEAGAGPQAFALPATTLPAGTGIPELYQAASRSLSPGEDIPRSRWVSGGWGLGPGWADGLAPAAPDPKGYKESLQLGEPQGQALRRRQCFKVSRCYRGQGAGRLFTEHPGPHQLPWSSLPHQRRCVCVSVSIPALKAEASSSSWTWPQPTPGRRPASLSFLGLCTMGGAPVALVRGAHRVGGGGSGGAPACAQCLPP